jgi:hypothetical protein
MAKDTTTTLSTTISQPATYLAIAASIATLLLLSILHVLSPEFDPSWHMVSEYANGQYGWVLSLMFAAWAISSWALAFAIRSQAGTRAANAKIGLFFLIAAAIGEAMASVFDINHPLHGLAGMIGIGSLPIAAMLISVSLVRTQAWIPERKSLLWTANLTWISVVLLIVSFIIMIVTYTQSGGDMSTTEVPTSLPAGVIAFVGWTNRFLIAVYCAWVIAVAWRALRLHKQES